MLNAYSASNNASSISVLQAQQQSLLASQQTATQPNIKAIASIEELQQQIVNQAQEEIQGQFLNMTSPVGRVNELGQVTGSFINVSV